MAVAFFVAFFVFFDIGQLLYTAGGGMDNFAVDVKQQANQVKPWAQWNFVMLDPESKTRFYLNLAPEVKNYSITGSDRGNQTAESLLTAWPFLRDADKKTDVIFVSRKQYESQLEGILKNYTVVEEKPGLGQQFMKNNSNLAIAFIPKNTGK
jgi:hypothetical protein